MTWKITEKDWKYLFGIKDELLQALCRRINAETMAIMQEEGLTEHEKHLKAYKHVENADQVIVKCFDDWKRSAMSTILINLCQNNLLTQDHLDRVSKETSEFLQGVMGKLR